MIKVNENEIIIDLKDIDPKIRKFRFTGLPEGYYYLFSRGKDDSEVVMMKAKIQKPEDFGGKAVDISFLIKDGKAIG